MSSKHSVCDHDVVDFREQPREHAPIHIDWTAVEKVESFKYLGVLITDDLKWSTHTDSVAKKAQQRLFNLSRLKKFVFAPKTLTNFYRCTIESILSGLATAPPATAGLSRGWCGLPNASLGENYLPFRTPTPPSVRGWPIRSSTTSTTRAKACSPCYHPEV
jgi:hypothetical protein